MVSKGDEVKVHVDIAKDGSGHTLNSNISTVPAVVVRPPEESTFGRYLLIITVDTLCDELDMTEEEVEEKLVLSEKNGYYGYKVDASKRNVEK